MNLCTHVAALQMSSTAKLEENLGQAYQLMQSAKAAGAQLLVLPENFALMADHASQLLAHQEVLGAGPIQDFLAKQSKELGVWLVAGSVPLQSSDPNKVFTACLVFDDQGERVARYNKVHLFDVDLPEKEERYRESDTFQAGNQVVTLTTPFGVLGLSICYDLRFPELYRQLVSLGAEFIVAPSAFTQSTGAEHWRLLCRTRALENSCYLIAANQCGEHANGRKTYGHSMIVDPWGHVLAEAGQMQGVVSADMTKSQLEGVRTRFPALKHRRFSINLMGK